MYLKLVIRTVWFDEISQCNTEQDSVEIFVRLISLVARLNLNDRCFDKCLDQFNDISLYFTANAGKML